MRVLSLGGAFTAGLVLFLAVFLLVAGPRLGTTPTAAAIGGSFELIDQHGQRITEQDFKGKPHLVFFGFTHCPDVCPTTLFEVSEVLRTLGPDANRTAALFVTVDPSATRPLQ